MRSKGSARFFFLFAAIIVLYGIFPNNAASSVMAQEKVGLEVSIAGVNNTTIEISYIVSIEDATFPEQIEDVDITFPGATSSVEKLDDFNYEVKISVPAPNAGVYTMGWLTTATEKYKNKLRKKNFEVKVEDTVVSPAGVPGFEFKSESDGIFTLFNDSSEDWNIDQLLVRINRDYVDLNDFDLDNPSYLDWDFDIAPFTLLAGDVYNFDLGQELISDPSIYSQFFVKVTETTTGVTVLDAGQHQHPVPEPGTGFLSGIGILFFIFLRVKGNRRRPSDASTV